MSVFLQNACHFSPGCRKNFATLSDLIVHIESEHLDFEPSKLDQLELEKLDSVPMSYILKFSNSEVAVKGEESTICEVPHNNNNYLSEVSREKKFASTGDMRVKKEEVFHFTGLERLFTLDGNQKKPFACNMPGCEKRYKNVNGIKYHYKNHHKIHTPSIRKSLLKYRSVSTSSSSTEIDHHQLHEILTFNPQALKDAVFHVSEEENSHQQGDYFYTLPTSSDQVPLTSTSFNYYNVATESDLEDFSGNNSIGFFVPTMDKM